MRRNRHKAVWSRAITLLRFCAATILTPLVMMIWLAMCVGVVFDCFGANPDGPAKIVLGMMILMLGFGVPLACLLCAGLPYALFMLVQRRLNFLAIILPSCLVSIAYSLLIYSSMQPHRYPAIASATALATAPGVLVAGLCFYIVGVWRNTPADQRG